VYISIQHSALAYCRHFCLFIKQTISYTSKLCPAKWHIGKKPLLALWPLMAPHHSATICLL